MTERWRIIVELTFNPITISGTEESRMQALYRIKPSLNRLLEKEVEISHYHIMKQPEKCIEFD
jgi:hypothetical protein